VKTLSAGKTVFNYCLGMVLLHTTFMDIIFFNKTLQLNGGDTINNNSKHIVYKCVETNAK
jgi:hypothetical protein